MWGRGQGEPRFGAVGASTRHLLREIGIGAGQGEVAFSIPGSCCRSAANIDNSVIKHAGKQAAVTVVNL